MLCAVWLQGMSPRDPLGRVLHGHFEPCWVACLLLVAFHMCLRFSLAMVMALRLKWGGCSMLATVCSSWVFLSRSTPLVHMWVQ